MGSSQHEFTPPPTKPSPVPGPLTAPPRNPVTWRAIGPGQFGAMFGIGISPHDPKVMAAGGDMGLAFMTRDGGQQWQMLGRSGAEPFGNPGYRGVWAVHFDPRRSERIFIGSTHGLFRTTDGGQNWRLILGGDADHVISAIGGDPDDQQSLIRLLLYANEFELEGLIATASGTPGELKEKVTKPHLIRGHQIYSNHPIHRSRGANSTRTAFPALTVTVCGGWGRGIGASIPSWDSCSTAGNGCRRLMVKGQPSCLA